MSVAAVGLAAAPLHYGTVVNGGFGVLADVRCQTRSPHVWGIVQRLAGDGVGTVDVVSLSVVDAIEQGPGGSKVVDLSFGWLPWASWTGAAQIALQLALGAAPGTGCFLFHMGLTRPVDIRKPAATADLRYVVGGRVVRIGALAQGEGPRRAVVAASQLVCFRSNLRFQTADAPLEPARKKQRFSAHDAVVIEFRERLQHAETFDEYVKSAVAHMEQVHPGDWFLRGGQAKLLVMAKQLWRTDRLAFQSDSPLPPRQWVLTLWQRRVLFALATERPQKRRLFWIQGSPGCGKGSLAEFLFAADAWNTSVFENVPLRFPGCMEATFALDKLQDFAMLYAKNSVDDSPPGIIVLDFPKATKFSPALVTALEKLTDVGQPVTHGKYKGAEPVLQSHVVVFSNAPPLEGLPHRSLWLLRVAGVVAAPEWEYPGAARGADAATLLRVQASAAVPLPEDAARDPGAPAAWPARCVVMRASTVQA